MWRWLVLCILSSSLAWSLSDQERVSAVQECFESNMQSVPRDLQKWLAQQSIPTKRFCSEMLRVNFKKLSSNLSRIERHFKKPYVAASKIQTPLQEYIVSEAPHRARINDFWQTLIDKKVGTVVALVTSETTPASSYWDKSKFPVKLSEWVIRLKSEKIVTTSVLFSHVKLVKRVFAVEGVRRDERRYITHFHIENWADHGPPVNEVFCCLLDSIDTVHPWNDRPIFVHCAGGIGRSGTFVAAHSIRKEIKQSGRLTTVNVAKRIIELRTQRAKLVSQPSQVHAVYAAVHQLLDKGHS